VGPVSKKVENHWTKAKNLSNDRYVTDIRSMVVCFTSNTLFLLVSDDTFLF